jgi:cell division protein FtsI/penicillin-binding protein 2
MQALHKRLRLITLALMVVSGVMIARLLSFQFQLDPEVQQQLYNVAGATEGRQVELKPNRGNIYDRDGEVLAVNTLEYRVGISPGVIGPSRETKRQAAKDLARLLDLNESEVFLLLLPDENTGFYARYVPLKTAVPLEVGAALEALDIPGLVIEPIYRRDYPQEALTAQILGFVNYDGRGYYGIEQHYQAELAGQSRLGRASTVPVDYTEDVNVRDGQDLVLTSDRDVQWVVQQALIGYIEQERAEYGTASTIKGGSIIVMNPKTGEILAMASHPAYSIEEYNNLPADQKPPLFNPAISYTYEPGSIFKIITASVALDIKEPGLDLFWTYNNLGCEVIAGARICDSETYAKGNQSFTQCLVRSLNTCTAHWNLIIGSARWYEWLQRFGLGVPTGVDMAGEESGTVNWPWTPGYGEQNFVQTSFGQGIAVTPLQMLTAANAIANGGVIMQPHIVKQFIDGDTIYAPRPTAIRRPIDATTAQMVLDLMKQAVYSDEGFSNLAAVDGYVTAGKTGTAQKLGPDYRYSETDSWASFIGFIPADNPHLSMIVMLDQPKGYWGSLTAAPLFREIVSRIVVLLEIPSDEVRNQLLANGGNPFGRE